MLFSVKPFQYRGKVWNGVDASFSSFLRAEEKDRLGSGGKPPQGNALNKK